MSHNCRKPLAPTPSSASSSSLEFFFFFSSRRRHTRYIGDWSSDVCSSDLNRLVDAEIDARNPRTKIRHIPAGLLSRTFCWGFTLAASALFLFAAWELNSLCRSEERRVGKGSSFG